LVANNIARQIEGRISYRRAAKMAIASAIRLGAEGIKIKMAGRLNGAEMARTEELKEGRTPLHTLRADIDYALGEALTTYGLIGVKVWICKGEVYGKRDLSPNVGQTGIKTGGTGSGTNNNTGGGKQQRMPSGHSGGGRGRGDKKRSK
jgi:small subunit ribosomal protein S3